MTTALEISPADRRDSHRGQAQGRDDQQSERADDVRDAAVRAHAEVAFAGCWGQARGRLGRRPGSHEVSAVLAGTGCRDREVLTAAGGPDAGESVVPLLERCWPSIAELAERLHKHGSVSQTGVLSEDSDPDARGLHDSQRCRAGHVQRHLSRLAAVIPGRVTTAQPVAHQCPKTGTNGPPVSQDRHQQGRTGRHSTDAVVVLTCTDWTGRHRDSHSTADWGSSGRRFKSCQPDVCDVPRHR
jgi:hypothetical protein